MNTAVRTIKGLFLAGLVCVNLHVSAESMDEEEYAIFERNDKMGLINKKGHVLIPPEYEALGWTNGGTLLTEDVIGFKKDGLWGILNLKNERVTEPEFTSLARFNENWIVASRKLPYNSKVVYGVINARGHAVLEFEYHKLQVHENHLIATIEKDDHYYYGVLDDRGKQVMPLDHDWVESISNHLYLVKRDDRVAIFDNKGNNVTEFSLDSAVLVSNEDVITYKDGKCGLVSRMGDFVLEPTYKHISLENGIFKGLKLREWKAFDHAKKHLSTYRYDEIIPKARNVYKVEVGEAQALIDVKDSLLTPFTNFEIQEKFAKWIAVKKEDKAGVLHFDGGTFLEPVYDSVRYENNLFLVRHKLHGKRGWSMYNRNGDMLTSEVYDQLSWLGGTYFSAKRDAYWGVVNCLGKEIIFCKYDSIMQYSEGKLLVNFLGEYGILNIDGSWEILPQHKALEIVDPLRYLVRSPFGSYVAYYPATKDFSTECFLYRHGDRYLEKTLELKCGLLDENGKLVIKAEFDSISSLYEDSIYYAVSAQGISFISKSGLVMNQNDRRFQNIRPMSEHYIGVKIDGRWGFVDSNGKLRVANQYEGIGAYSEGLAPIKILGRWGFIDKREKLTVQPKYDTVYQFNGGLSEVVRKGKYGLINPQGQVLLQCEYDDIKRLKTGGFLTRLNGRYGLVSREGRLLILPKFTNMKDLDNGYVIASRKGKYGLLSNDGVAILPMIYEKLVYDSFNDLYLAAGPEEWELISIP